MTVTTWGAERNSRSGADARRTGRAGTLARAPTASEREHRDPFDRLLVAQASVEAMTLVTVDRSMRDLPAPTVLTW